MLRKIAGLLRPSVCSLGYAVFLAVNATGIWGGVFPFLPFEIQTSDVMFWFYLAQSLMLFATFSVAGVGSVFSLVSRWKSSARVMGAAAVYFVGWALLIAGMYLRGIVGVLTVAGGVFLGAGAGLFYLLWQRLFAGQRGSAGLRDLIVGFVYAAVFYAALYLIPRAVTAYLIPLVFLPLFALALILGNRRADCSQPMFSDVPRENLRVYRRALLGMWRSALCMGALALVAGLVRSVAIERPEVGSSVNLLSMGALLVAAVAVLALWRLKSVRMNLIKLYQVVFPVIITAFAVSPFLWAGYLRWLAAGLFALYSVGLMLTMMQCMQVSRDRGVNPTFAFGFFGGIVYGLHDVGFILGSLAERLPSVAGASPALTTAVIAIYLLALMFFVAVVNFKNSTTQLLYGDTIELMGPPAHAQSDARAAAGRKASGARMPENGAASARRASARGHATDGRDFKDRLGKQMAALQETYRLSDREAEVAELIVRGNTVARIAERLYISENTVRTHAKRIYSKAGVHKKQELVELVESF